jgi:ribonuclease III
MMIDRIRAWWLQRGLEPEDRNRIAFLVDCFGEFVIEPGNYLKALRHRSKLIDAELNDSDSYERLEFLGDSVLDLIITEILFERFSEKDEGFMTQMRSKLVKGDTLAGYSRQLGLPQVVELGERARGQGIENSTSILGDVFEALIGALYKDRGYFATRRFVEKVLDNNLDIKEVAAYDDNYKSILMEYAQARRMKIPVYRVIQEDGPAHNRIFIVEVLVGDQKAGEGSGKSKKIAEQEAAREAYERLKNDK